jgi:hypothetical protein
MKIIVAGVISLSPFSPGIAWDWLQFAVGFARLGHDVYFVEEVEPKWCVGADGRACPYDRSVNRDLFRSTMRQFGLAERSCQIYNGGEAAAGMSAEALRSVAKEADLLVNISGHLKAEWVLGAPRCRAYVDQDPVFTQLWYAEYNKGLNLRAHDVFFTVGLSIGTPHTHIPDGDIRWHPLLPPVVLDYWPFRGRAGRGRFTTIASWAGYSDLSFRGEWYGTKVEEFKRFAGLPRMTDQPLEVAMKRNAWDEPGVRQLRDSGWIVSDASRIGSLAAYRDFIAESRAEIGIAKNAYVRGRSGWFSDRSSHYLASGKPVLAQATGFEKHLPTGKGLLAFGTVEEAAEGIRAINGDYESHCRAARTFAEEHLDYARVLPRMLDACAAA